MAEDLDEQFEALGFQGANLDRDLNFRIVTISGDSGQPIADIEMTITVGGGTPFVETSDVNGVVVVRTPTPGLNVNVVIDGGICYESVDENFQSATSPEGRRSVEVELFIIV